MNESTKMPLSAIPIGLKPLIIATSSEKLDFINYYLQAVKGRAIEGGFRIPMSQVERIEVIKDGSLFKIVTTNIGKGQLELDSGIPMNIVDIFLTEQILIFWDKNPAIFIEYLQKAMSSITSAAEFSQILDSLLAADKENALNSILNFDDAGLGINMKDNFTHLLN